MNFKPSPGFLILEVIPVKPRDVRGKANIIIPDNAKGLADDFHAVEELWDEWFAQGKVMAVGEDLPSIPNDKKVGDIVYLSRQFRPSDAVLIEKKVYACVRYSETLGKITDGKENM